MKKRLLFFVLFSLTIWQHIFAYDFEVDGIFYTVSSFENYTVAVDGLNQSMSGIIDIPSTITYNNKTFSVTSIKSLSSNKIESINIPASISIIEDYAFAASSITHIFIPDNVTKMGRGVFNGCKSLVTATITKNVESLMDFLFSGCSSLKQLEWHPDCKYGNIWGGAFNDCKSLTTIRIPSGIHLLNHEHNSAEFTTAIFKNCVSLDSLIIEEGDEELYLPGAEHSPHDVEFQDSKIRYVYVGRPIRCSSTRYAPNLGSVRHLVIGDNVSELPYWIPKGGVGLKTLVIGSSLKNVTDFSDNSSLEFIRMRGAPPTASGFSNYNYINTIIYVPKGTKAVYETSDIWKNFWNIQEYDFDGGDVKVEKCAKPTINYSNGKLTFVCETEDAICQASITDTDIKTYSGNEIQLGVTYVINVYATKAGYDNSETVTATLCWIDVEPKTEGIVDNSIASVRAKAVLIQSNGSTLDISGADSGSAINVYDTAGRLVGAAKASAGTTSVGTSLSSGEIGIVKIGEKAVKVVIR